MSRPLQTRKELRKNKRLQDKQRKAECQEEWRKRKHSDSTESSPKPKEAKRENKSSSLIAFSQEDLELLNPSTESTHLDDAQEDEKLIEYLERKLGMSGDKRAREKMQKSITEDDLGGDDVLDFACEILGEKTKRDTQSGSEDEESENLDLTVETAESNQGQDPIPKDISSTKNVSTSVYIPPHLRKVQQQDNQKSMTPEEVMESRRPQIRSLFNRVAEGNLNPLLVELKKIIAGGIQELEMGVLGTDEEENAPRLRHNYLNLVAESFADEAVRYLEMKASANLLGPQAAMITALSASISKKIGVSYFGRILQLWKDMIMESCKDGQYDAASTMSLGAENFTIARQSCSCFAFLYFYGLLGPRILLSLFEVIAEFVDVPSSRKLGLISQMLTLIGWEFRSSHPEEAKKALALSKELLEKARKEPNISPEEDERLSFFEHELQQFSTSKGSKRTPMQEKLLSMRVWLQSKKGAFKSVNWAAVQIDCSNSQARRKLEIAMNSGIFEMEGNEGEFEPVEIEGGETDTHAHLKELARRLLLKTPLQQQIFVCMTAAESVEDAARALLKVAPKRSQIEHVVAVILHCASREKSYNEFYEQLLLELCLSPDKQVSSWYSRGVRQGLHSLVSGLEDESDEKLKKRKLIVAKKLGESMNEREVFKASDSLFKKIEHHDS